jgi:hypothetical protein
LGARSEQFGVSDDFLFVAIEPIAMAIRACGYVPRDDRVTALANFEISGGFNDLSRPGRTLGKIAIRHSHPIPDCASPLNAVSLIGQISSVSRQIPSSASGKISTFTERNRECLPPPESVPRIKLTSP